MFFSIDTLSEMSEKIAKKTEGRLLEQLNDFISRGLIHVESGSMLFIRSPNTSEITLSQTVKLVLKDKEYIESLEKKVAILEEMTLKLKELNKG